MMNWRRFLTALMTLALLTPWAACGEADDPTAIPPEAVASAETEPAVCEGSGFDLGDAGGNAAGNAAGGDAAAPYDIQAEVPKDGEGQTTITLFDTRHVSRTIEIDETLCIIVDIDDVTVRKWSSSKTKVATVTDYGGYALVKPYSAGTAKLTAKLSNKKKITVSVTVVDPTLPDSVYFTERRVAVPVGERYYMEEIVALTPETAKSTYTWKVSNKKIASVDGEGVLTGRRVGDTKVTVTTRNKMKATIDVTVLPNRVTDLSDVPRARDISAVEGFWTLWPCSVEMQSDGRLCCEFYLINGSDQKTKEIDGMRLSLAVGDPDNVIAEHIFARTKVSCKRQSYKCFKVTFPAGSVTDTGIYLPDYSDALYFNLLNPETVSLKAGKHNFEYKPTAFPVEPQAVPVKSIELLGGGAVVWPGESVQLQAIVRPDNATDPRITWTSDNPAAATVDEGGRVTTHAQGVAVITATAVDGSGVSASCIVTADQSAAYVKLSQTRLSLKAGERATLTAEAVPQDPTVVSTFWESSAPAVATVDDGRVTALSEGTATITATMVSESGVVRTGTCEVTVAAGAPVPVEGVAVTPLSVYLITGQTRKLKAAVQPENATNQAVAWSSSRESVASVVDGLVTARAAGTALITATTADGGFTAACQVTVMANGQAFVTEKGAVVGYLGSGGNVKLPAREGDGSAIVAVGPSAFEGSALQSVELPDTLRTIGARAFADTGLVSVVIPSGVREIADDAFAGCDRFEPTVYKDSYADQWCASHGVTPWRIIGLGAEARSQSAIRAFMKAHPVDLTAAVEYRVAPSTTEPYAPGLLSEATIQNALNMVNQCRYIAGLNADVVNDPDREEALGAVTLINALNGKLSSKPSRPEALSDAKYDALFALAQEGAGASNLGGGWPNPAVSVVNGYMVDSDEKNISKLAHRRRILCPSMGKTAFGACGRYSGMYAMDRTGSGKQTRVAWPASQMPAAYFKNTTAWSVSYGKTLGAEAMQVELTRRYDGKSWRFSADSADGSFHVNNSNIGAPGCVIFRPDGLDAISAGDVFDVTITNATDRTILKYSVTFFE